MFEDGFLDFEKVNKIDINYQNIILDTAKLFIKYPNEVSNVINLLLSLKYMENYVINTSQPPTPKWVSLPNRMVILGLYLTCS